MGEAIQAGTGSNESRSHDILADRPSEEFAKWIAGSCYLTMPEASLLFRALIGATLPGSSARQTDCHLQAQKMTCRLGVMFREHCSPSPHGLYGLIAEIVSVVCQTLEC